MKFDETTTTIKTITPADIYTHRRILGDIPQRMYENDVRAILGNKYVVVGFRVPVMGDYYVARNHKGVLCRTPGPPYGEGPRLIVQKIPDHTINFWE